MELIESMMRLQFSHMEARVYICLTQYGQQNGSQIAKELNASRSSVYAALGNLHERGAVFMLPGDPTEYKAENYEHLFDQLQQDYTHTIHNVKEELAKKQNHDVADQYWNIEGHSNCIQKACSLISSAETEIFLHTNLPFTVFKQEIKQALDRGVRIIAFSFIPVDLEGIEGIELYYDDKFGIAPSADKRLMLAVDLDRVLLAGGRENSGFLGTYSHNNLLVAIIAEHIHHDIYLYKLEQKLGANLIDDSIKMHSLLENNFLSWLNQQERGK
ncbi:TrmB family transcriptional regulator [Spirochaeta dissipatitropha]